jgi:NADH-quinone oxidoreductase subunit H
MDAFIVITLIKLAVIAFVLLTAVAYLQWVERKVIAHIQVRPGPYRVGPHGLLQPLADVIKLITKEDMMPPYVNKPLYLFAPFLAVAMALLSIAVIPFGPQIAVHSGGVIHGRLRGGAGGMVFQQQVRAAGRSAQFGADDQL